MSGINNDFKDIVEHRLEMCKSILIDKAKEYSTNDNRWANFEDVGALANTTPEMALWNLLGKHISSMKKIILDINEKGKYPDDKLIDEKITDVINYMLLAEGLIKNRRNDTRK